MSNRRCCTGIIYEVLSIGAESPADFRSPRDCFKSQGRVCSVITADNKVPRRCMWRGGVFYVRDVFYGCSLTFFWAERTEKKSVQGRGCNVSAALIGRYQTICVQVTTSGKPKTQGTPSVHILSAQESRSALYYLSLFMLHSFQ